MGTLVHKMAICEFYARIYEELSKLASSTANTGDSDALQNISTRVESALPELYAAVLVFSVKARQYFEPLNARTGNISSYVSILPFMLTLHRSKEACEYPQAFC